MSSGFALPKSLFGSPLSAKRTSQTKDERAAESITAPPSSVSKPVSSLWRLLKEGEALEETATAEALRCIRGDAGLGLALRERLANTRAFGELILHYNMGAYLPEAWASVTDLLQPTQPTAVREVAFEFCNALCVSLCREASLAPLRHEIIGFLTDKARLGDGLRRVDALAVLLSEGRRTRDPSQRCIPFLVHIATQGLDPAVVSPRYGETLPAVSVWGEDDVEVKKNKDPAERKVQRTRSTRHTLQQQRP